jgi:hypothetical protein
MSLSPLDRMLAKKAATYIVTTTPDAPKGDKPQGGKSKGNKPAKVATASVAQTSEEKAPSPSAEQIASMQNPILPLAGTYDARRFMTAWRHAKDRNEKIQAIAGYVGFDYRAAFSAEEQRALFQARKDTIGVTPGKDRSQRSADHSLKGFVAGLPDNFQAKIDNLKARERVVVEEIAAANKRAQDESLSREERAEAEAERLTLTAHALHPLREDLKRLGADD